MNYDVIYHGSYIVYFVLIIFILWLFNLEINPSLGSVWLRPDENGNTTLAPMSIVNLLIKPFESLFLWDYHFWDVNFYMFLFISTIIFFIIKHICNILNRWFRSRYPRPGSRL